MTTTQLEYADAYTDPLPLKPTLERMRMLLIDLECAYGRLEKKQTALDAIDRLKMNIPPAAHARLTTQTNQAALRVREINDEIVAVARLIVAEANNQELIGERNTE